MIYVTSDIHGNYTKYQKLLDKINLTEKDALIILGDIVDRGKESMEILLDVMTKDNIFVILGNHEQIALSCLKVLSQEITEESIANLEQDKTDMLVEWLYNLGGQATLDSFTKLSKTQQKDVLEFIEELPLYEELEIKGQKYLLVHGGLGNFSKDKDIDDYSDHEILWERIDYGMQYFDDTIVITGHTPTRNIDDNPKPDYIYKQNNHLGIDCGCGFSGGQLGCICLNTMEEFYI